MIGFTGSGVELGDGSLIEPDVVIAATGYRRTVQSLVGHLGVLEDGRVVLLHYAADILGFPGISWGHPDSGWIVLDREQVSEEEVRHAIWGCRCSQLT